MGWFDKEPAVKADECESCRQAFAAGNYKVCERCGHLFVPSADNDNECSCYDGGDNHFNEDSIKQFDDNLEFDTYLCSRCGDNNECVVLSSNLHLCSNCLNQIADHLSE